MIDCPKFAKMQKMFKRKITLTLDEKMIVSVKIIIAKVNVINIKVATKSHRNKCSRRENQGITTLLHIGRKRN
jgi:hypothetical protein